jgi:hypothetical protein
MCILNSPYCDVRTVQCVHRVLLRSLESDNTIAILCTLRMEALLTEWALASPFGPLCAPLGRGAPYQLRTYFI